MTASEMIEQILKKNTLITLYYCINTHSSQIILKISDIPCIIKCEVNIWLWMKVWLEVNCFLHTWRYWALESEQNNRKCVQDSLFMSKVFFLQSICVQICRFHIIFIACLNLRHLILILWSYFLLNSLLHCILSICIPAIECNYFCCVRVSRYFTDIADWYEYWTFYFPCSDSNQGGWLKIMH